MAAEGSEHSEMWRYRMTSRESLRWRHAAPGEQESIARELVFRVAEQAHRHGRREFVICDSSGEAVIHGTCRTCRTRRFDPHRFAHLYNLN